MNTDNSRRDSLDRSQTSLSSLDFGKPKGWPSYGNIGEHSLFMFFIIRFLFISYSFIRLVDILSLFVRYYFNFN